MGAHGHRHHPYQGAGADLGRERPRRGQHGRAERQLSTSRFHQVGWRLRTRSISAEEHTLLMGVVNVTPDSFSDGGRYLDAEAAIAHGRDLITAGADIIDVGGESTRPGSAGIHALDEIERVAPVVAGLAGEGAVVSIDTSKPEVATAAIEAGAEIVNDVTALGAAGMAAVCAGAGVGIVLMHMAGAPRTMQDDPQYGDVVAEVSAYLDERVAHAEAAGIAPDRICIDPGIGFGKTFEHNLELLSNLTVLTSKPQPVLVGPSRKGFIGHALEAAGRPRRAAERDVATAAAIATSIWQGATVIRVHDVVVAADVGRLADAIVRRRR